MIHRFPRFHSTHSECGLDYGQVCRLNHAYVITDHDACKVTCPNCKRLQSRPPASSVSGHEGSAGSAASHIVAMDTLEATGSDAGASSVIARSGRAA